MYTFSKKISILLCFVIVLSLLAGCGSEAGNSVEGETVDENTVQGDVSSIDQWAETIKEKYGGTKINLSFASHPATEALQKMTKDFEEATGIEVEWEVLEETYLKNKQLLDFTGQTGTYDILMVDGFWLNEYGEKGVLHPIDDYLSDATLTPEWFGYDDINAAYRNGISKYNDQTLGIPIAGETRYVAYRTDLFEKYDKEPPQTMDELLELAEFFAGKEPDLYGIAMRAQRGIHNASGLMTVMYNFGGGFINQETGEVTMTDPKTVEALQFYVDLLQFAPPDVVSYTHEEAISAFMSGRAAMWLDSTAISTQILDPDRSSVHDVVDFVPTPEGPAGRASALAGWNMSIATHSENKEAAWAFIVYMTSQEMAKDYVLNGGTPVRTSVLEDEELVAENHSYPVQLEALDDANVLVEQGISWIPPHENLTQALDRVGYYGSLALAGEISVEEAAESAQEELEEILK